MNKTWDLAFIGLAIVEIVYSLIGDDKTKDFFGFEVNTWTFRALWGLVAVACYFTYKKKKKLESDANNQN